MAKTLLQKIRSLTWFDEVNKLIEILEEINISVSSFIALTDTPNTYAGQAGKILGVNQQENGLEFIEQSGGGGDNPENIEQVLTNGNTTTIGIISNANSLTGYEYAFDAIGNIRGNVLYANFFQVRPNGKIAFGGGGLEATSEFHSSSSGGAISAGIGSNAHLQYDSTVKQTFSGRELPDVNYVQQMIDAAVAGL